MSIKVYQEWIVLLWLCFNQKKLHALEALITNFEIKSVSFDEDKVLAQEVCGAVKRIKVVYFEFPKSNLLILFIFTSIFLPCSNFWYARSGFNYDFGLHILKFLYKFSHGHTGSFLFRE